jgi:hypothetical protein
MISHGDKFHVYFSDFVFFVTCCEMCFLPAKHVLTCPGEISCFLINFVFISGFHVFCNMLSNVFFASKNVLTCPREISCFLYNRSWTWCGL